MRGHKMPEAHASHPNVTPLIDIVMCLIIFYMLVAKIGVATGAESKIDLPEALRGIQIKDMGNTITLNITPAGDEPFITTLADGKMVDVKLGDLRNGPLAKFLKTLRGQNAEFKVILRADQNMDYRFLEPVLLVCAEAKVKNVNFATKQAPRILSVTSNP